ncbi:hypothetical protein BS47DRAFT_1366496 [Hydnum rufescens UP504]|uniref:Uncharacterized protein n=1 Tax=Hydnum rufescens UP504 TaxID=1448309 RepID=A0A9P6AMT4_9AGAM|nr:hypothetical protein BS47DRAFT_1366496 [Hydnum rufescens UP504]
MGSYNETNQRGRALVVPITSPSTELESAVDWLLKASKLREEDIKQTEELQMSNLTIKEVAARQVKAKRISKIKSKTFWKIQKKAREKNALMLDRIGALDPEAANLNSGLHAPKNGQPCDTRIAANFDVDQWQELNAQLEHSKQLRHKIQGLNEDDDAPEDFIESDGENDVPEERGYCATKSMADDFRAELVTVMADGIDIVGSEGDGPSALEAVQGNQGRLIFCPTADQSQNAGPSRVMPVCLTKSNESNTSSVTLKSSIESVTASPQLDLGPPSLPSQHIPPSDRESLAGEPATSVKEKNEILVSKKSSLASKSKVALKKQLARTEDALSHEVDDAVVEISLDKAMTIDHAKQKPKQKSKQEGKETMEVVNPVVDPTFWNPDDDGDGAEEEGVKAFEQRNLVALAFAGDNVGEREIEADAPTTVDMMLPGWGSWGGRGTKKSQPKPHFIQKVPGVAPAACADTRKAQVIISERKDKKAGCYMVKDLPHLYTTKAYFESSLEMPIGPEWNTRMGFQKSTLPKVIKKQMGTVINPTEKLF